MRTRSLAAVAAALLLTVAACSGDDSATESDDPGTASTMSPADAMEVVADAATATLEEPTAQVRMEVTPAGADGAGTGTTTTATDGASPADVTILDVAEDLENQRRAITPAEVDLDAQDVRVVVDHGIAYVPAGDPEADPRPVFQIDLDQLEEQEGIRIEGLPEGFPFRVPRELLAVLAGGAGEARAADPADADPSAYEVTLDPDAPAASDSAERWLARATERTGGDPPVLEVRLAEGRVAEVAYDVAAAGADGGELTVLVRYTDLGAPVEVTVPEGDHVMPVSPEELRAALANIPLGTTTETTTDTTSETTDTTVEAEADAEGGEQPTE